MDIIGRTAEYISQSRRVQRTGRVFNKIAQGQVLIQGRPRKRRDHWRLYQWTSAAIGIDKRLIYDNDNVF